MRTSCACSTYGDRHRTYSGFGVEIHQTHVCVGYLPKHFHRQYNCSNPEIRLWKSENCDKAPWGLAGGARLVDARTTVVGTSRRGVRVGFNRRGQSANLRLPTTVGRRWIRAHTQTSDARPLGFWALPPTFLPLTSPLLLRNYFLPSNLGAVLPMGSLSLPIWAMRSSASRSAGL